MKRMFAFALGLLLLMNLHFPVYADGMPDYGDPEARAYMLKHLGLFKGVSETDFALDKPATRLEALVMLIRLMGEENQALALTKISTPFTDLPDWGKPYVAYAYQKGYTKGVSADKFDPHSRVEGAAFFTFVLRALGYSDSPTVADFRYENAVDFADQRGLISSELAERPFQRGEAVIVLASALEATLKNSDIMLIQALYEKGAISTYQLYSVGFESSYEGVGPRDAVVKKVHNVDELIKAVADDTIVIMAYGQYDIGAYAREHCQVGKKMFNGQALEEEGLKWLKLSDKVEFEESASYDVNLVFKDLKNFHLVGEEGTEIFCAPGVATVLTLDNCKECSLSHLNMGHKPEGTCSGDVLKVIDSEKIAVAHSELYGCGSSGLLSLHVHDLFAYGNIIRDCSFSGLSLVQTDQAKVLRNVFLNNPVNIDKARYDDIIASGNAFE